LTVAAPRHVRVRALLTAVALVVLVPAALIVLGGFVPTLPFVGRLGQLVIAYLPGATEIPGIIEAGS